MGFKCLIFGYDISDDACDSCSQKCEYNTNKGKLQTKQGEIEMEDIRGEPVEITISEDRKTVLVTVFGCFKFRAREIPELKIVDNHNVSEHL